MDPAPTRWTLIRRAADGDADDRAAFAERYAPVVRATLAARWRGTPLAEDLDDAAQQVFVDCFRDGGVLQRADPARPGGFGAYLFGVTRTVAADVERARAKALDRRDGGASALDGVPADEASLAAVFDRAWASALMGEAAELQLLRARTAGEDAVRRHRLLGLRHGEDLPIRNADDLPPESAAFWAEVDAAIAELEGG